MAKTLCERIVDLESRVQDLEILHPHGPDDFPQTTRIPIPTQAITNSGAVWNTLSLSTPSFDEIGVTVVGVTAAVPANGTYHVTSAVNVFDNNSARVQHRMRYLVNGIEYSRVEGHNYIRDASNQDEAHNVYPDAMQLLSGDVITIEMQTASSVVNTSDVLDSWLIIERTK